MRILVLTLDPQLAREESRSFARHIEYGKHHELVCLVFSLGSTQTIQRGNLRVITPGAHSRMGLLVLGTLMLVKVLRTERFDLVLTQDVLITGILGWIASKIWRTPLIVQLHGDYLNNPLWIKQRSYNWILNGIGKRLLHAAAGIRAVSERIRTTTIKHFKIQEERIISAPIGSELNIFTPDGPRSELPSPFILFVGRLIDEKDPLLFMAIACTLLAQYPELHAVVVGQGDLQEAMQQQARDAGLAERFVWFDTRSAAELAVLYRSALC